MNVKSASFFAGVGGIDMGFEKAGFTTAYANEIDQNASVTFKANFPHIPIDVCDIRTLDEAKIPDFQVMLAGFPCQAFSIAGYRQGFADEKGRGNLFFDLLRIIEAKKPEVVFLENVKNLLTHDKGNTFSVIYSSLEAQGYHITYKILNAAEYGNIPQARERIYIVCFRNREHYDNFAFPEPVDLKKTLSDVIDFDGVQEDRFYYTDTCPFYDKLQAEVIRSDTCYQWRRVYVRENKSNVCPTLTANMGTGGHNVPIIKTHSGNIRKLTPRECFQVQGFPSDFILPETLSNGALYKQAGNSVAVPVIERIAIRIQEALGTSC